ncbi:Oligoribonuclease [Corchorus olitorius]|uniref:Oligoribonuclease n=1 Tax=Corchorus olitorius TaxID=93759 RepID=A0A1R3HIE7_9ROSI|nr:Oligoribonuclease [Corchorus olitorius]
MYAIKEALKDLFEEYRRVVNPQTSQAKGVADLIMDEQVDDDTGDAMQQFLKHQKVKSGLEANKSELDIYLQEQMKQEAGAFDVLLWWKLIVQGSLPILALQGMCLLFQLAQLLPNQHSALVEECLMSTEALSTL